MIYIFVVILSRFQWFGFKVCERFQNIVYILLYMFVTILWKDENNRNKSNREIITKTT